MVTGRSIPQQARRVLENCRNAPTMLGRVLATNWIFKPGAARCRAGDATGTPGTSELKEKFTEFVGQTLFGSMLASMRKTLGKPAYMHGGRTEEVFQQQLDQVIVEDLTEASADSIATPMFDLFSMQKRSS